MSEESEHPQRGRTARLSEDAGGRSEGRRTERLSAGGDEWTQREPVNPGWRSERTSGARRTRSSFPKSPQEFQIWIQTGGWRYLAGIAALFLVLLIALLAYGRNDQRSTGLGLEDEKAPTSVVGVGGPLPAYLPTITPAPTTPPLATFFIVTGTGSDGLFLRADPSTTIAPLITIAEGTRIERIGEDIVAGTITWRKVRTPEGLEGWVATNYLVPVP